MKRIILPILFALFHLTGHAQLSEQMIIEEINKAASQLSSMQCDFVQTKELNLLNDKLISKGRMYYQQANKLRWEYISPYTYTFILNGAKVVLRKKERNDVIDVNQNRMFREIVHIMMSSVVGKCLSDTKSFKTSIKDADTEWVATLVPQTKEMKQMFTRIILHFDKRQSVVVRVEMCEKNGDNTEISLTNIKKNQQIDAKVFSLD